MYSQLKTFLGWGLAPTQLSSLPPYFSITLPHVIVEDLPSEGLRKTLLVPREGGGRKGEGHPHSPSLDPSSSKRIFTVAELKMVFELALLRR
ncbi:unnamed protein product [Ilex paraguariensis]|uniref:Uncharacterized protein n=1 Tax=Ilex paraguariensis TaxID=185542 RepID=A0ABC8R8E7_9AQUA